MEGSIVPNKNLFGSAAVKVPEATATNEAGGKAYKMTAKAALAQYAVTATFHDSYYIPGAEQLEAAKRLCAEVNSLEYVAKAAVYGRTNGKMKDVTAFLLAYVWANAKTPEERRLFTLAMPRVITHGKMLSAFVQIVRSGVLGRKSLANSFTQRQLEAWLESITNEKLFRQSVGFSNPSMKDILKLVRPKPKSDARRALYGYLAGHEASEPGAPRMTYLESKLPAIVREYEAFKRNPEKAPLPNVPFNLLTSLSLQDKHWINIAKRASWQQARQQLNAFAKHGVFKDAEAVKIIASKLRNREAVKEANLLPYQLFMTYLFAGENSPREIVEALHDALDIAIENIPEIDGGVFVGVDVSGSMDSPVTGSRGTATSKATCRDVAALIASAILRRNKSAEILPFSDRLNTGCRFEPRDSIFTNADKLRKLPSGGTDCSIPLRELNKRKAKGKLVVMCSDNESWIQPTSIDRCSRGTDTQAEWLEFNKRNPGSVLVNIDLATNETTQVLPGGTIVNVGGFSDNVFRLLAEASKGILPGEKKKPTIDPDFWVKQIEAVDLHSAVKVEEETTEAEDGEKSE